MKSEQQWTFHKLFVFSTWYNPLQAQLSETSSQLYRQTEIMHLCLLFEDVNGNNQSKKYLVFCLQSVSYISLNTLQELIRPAIQKRIK